MEVSPKLQVAAALTLTPQEKRPGGLCLGDWVGLIVSLVAVKERTTWAMYA